MQEIIIQDIDELQDIVVSSIIKYAKLILLGKKVIAESVKITKTKESDKTKKDVKKIRIVCHTCTKELG